MSQQTPQSQYHQQANYQQDLALSNLDIYNIFRSKGFNIDSEKSITEPTQEFFNNILVYSASLILKIPVEEINQSEICNQSDQEMENSLKTLHCYQKMKYIRQMLDLIGIEDLCSYDIIKPEKKKVRKTLVGITQFILYQETIINTHIQILEKNRLDEQKIKRYAEELDTLRFHSEKLRERKEAEKNLFEQKMQQYEKLTVEHDDLLKQKQNLHKEKQEKQAKKLQMEQAIHKAEEDIQKMKEGNQKEKMKIVKSPFKLKDQCQSLQDEIESLLKELELIKKDFQFVQMKKSYNDILLQKIRKHLTLPSLTLEEMLNKENEANRILKNAKIEIKELQLNEEKSRQQKLKISENHTDLSSQLDQKNKLAEEKKKIYEDEFSFMMKEQLKLKEELSQIQQTITEISLMQKNLEQNNFEQERTHDLFMKEKKKQMEDLIEGLNEYKKDIFLLIKQEKQE